MIIDGKAVAEKRLEDLKIKIADLRIKPKLVAIIVGDNPASEMYVSRKAKKAMEVGIDSETIKLSTDTADLELIKQIRILNENPSVTGILLQLPFPKGSPTDKNTRKILDAIDPAKDVDCLTSANMGLLAIGQPRFYPATVRGILTLLGEALSIQYSVFSIDDKYLLAGKKVTIIGRSDIVGKPLAMALINLGATVTICNSKTKSLSEQSKNADILISAAGVPGLVRADMVKSGAIVIDAGINARPDGKAVGDVDFENVEKIASAISPVPGGVGPMTIVSLLENTFDAYSPLGEG